MNLFTTFIFKLLLWTQLIAVSAFTFTTVGSSWWQACVAFTTDFLFTSMLPGKCLIGKIHGTTTKTKNQMESGFLLDVVIRQCTSIFQLLSSKNQSLLIGRNSFLVLNLGLDIFNAVRGLNLQGNCLSSKCFDKDLHSTQKIG